MFKQMWRLALGDVTSPHPASSPPPALASSVAVHWVLGCHPGPRGTVRVGACSRLPYWWLLPHHCLRRIHLTNTHMLLVSSATEPSVQLHLMSGTICRQTSDSQTCHTAIVDSRWRRFNLGLYIHTYVAYWTIRWQTNLRSVKWLTDQLVDWITRGLDNSRTGQLAFGAVILSTFCIKHFGKLSSLRVGLLANFPVLLVYVRVS